MAFRTDIGTLQPPKRLPDGRLVAEGLLTRAGVFTYRNPDGSARRELRLPEEVFRGDALESFAMVPVTNDHPANLLDSKSARQYAVGAVGENVRRDGDFVRARLTVFDADTVAAMEAGKTALSCGYEVDLEETPGEHPQFGHYDAVQKNIRGNHVAIVDSARAGDAARVRMDASVQIADAELNAEMRHNLREGQFAVPDREGLPIEDEAHCRAAMARFNQYQFQSAAEKKAAYGRIVRKAKSLGIDTTNFEREYGGRADEEINMQELAILKAQLDEATATLASEKARADGAEAALETLTKQVEALTQSRQDNEKLKSDVEELNAKLLESEKARADASDPVKFRAAVARRVKIEDAAKQILGSADYSEHNDRSLMAAVIAKTPVIGGEVLASASDEFVTSRFDSCVKMYSAGEAAKETLRRATRSNHSEKADRQDARSARERFEDEMKSLGSRPLNQGAK
jgi:hypothetical protein